MKASFFAILLLILVSAFAPNDAFALTISPTKIEAAGDPGQTVIGEIELFNEQSEAKTFFTTFENFEPRGETGSPYFVGGGVGLATWLSASESVIVNPGERVVVPYAITIPADATPGGYFAAIFFGNQPAQGESGGEVSVGGKVGTLILLRVNGDVAEGGGLLDFSTDGGRVFTAIPIQLSYRFNNTGGDRVIPRGEVVVRNTIGQEVVLFSANKNEGSVLPNSVRKFELLWEANNSDMDRSGFFASAAYQLRNFHFGLYKATISLTWGETKQTATESVRFLILPWQLLSLVVGGGVLLVVLLRFYNRMIIARAKRS
jgi:hypothetical protein